MALIHVGVFVLALLAYSEGLKCYSCSGSKAIVGGGSSCNDEFKPPANGSMLVTCDANSKFCKKEVTGAGGLYSQVTRSCAEDCSDRNLVVNKVLCCQMDSCNTAATIYTTAATMCSVIVMVIVSRL